MKIPIYLGAILLIGSAAFALNLYQNNRSLQTSLDNYDNHVQQLLSQVEEISRRRIAYEKEITQLRSDLAQSNSQLISLTNRLQSAQNQVDPDYAQVENDMRARIAAEFAELNYSQTHSHTALVRQLSQLDETEFSNLIAMQGRFGAFLSSLNVSDQRMDVVIGALTNMVDQQNMAQQHLMEQQMQLRTDQIAEIRASGGGGQEIRERMNNIDFQVLQQQMSDIYSPQAQTEALAFDLTDDELAAFTRFQQNQQQNSPLSLGSSSSGPAFISNGFFTDGFGGSSQDGQYSTNAIRILQVGPQ